MQSLKLFRRAVLSAVVAVSFIASAETSIIREQLQTPWNKAQPTEVMVLATPHLSAFKESYQAQAMQPVLEALQRFAPDRIAIEVLPPATIRQLQQDGSPAAAQLLDMFASHITERAEAMHAQHGSAQHSGSESALKLQRLYQLIQDYQWHSAALYWQTLPAELQQQAELPDAVRAALVREQGLVNEVNQIAMPLARQLGLTRLEPVDDHSDGLMIMSWPENQMKSVFFHPLKKALASDPVLQASTPKFAAALKTGSLLAFYSWINSIKVQQDDVRIQWGAYLKMDDTEDYGPSRAALWEARNSAIATNISRISAQPGVKRVLVIYGSAHKPFLDAYLGAFAHIRLRQFEEFSIDDASTANRH